MTWDVCVVCGWDEHAPWCERVRRAMAEADRNMRPKNWWPSWLSPVGESYTGVKRPFPRERVVA